MTDRLTLGQMGEAKAKTFLAKKGYRILQQNYRCTLGEIDLICEDNSQLVFVEVKTRRTAAFGNGAESVNFKKQQKLIKVAYYYMKQNRCENKPFRFDVISILELTPEKIVHICGAFP